MNNDSMWVLHSHKFVVNNCAAERVMDMPLGEVSVPAKPEGDARGVLSVRASALHSLSKAYGGV